MMGSVDRDLAYHTVVLAMEGAGRFDARQRFALAVKSSLCGQVPHVRYRIAAAKRVLQQWGATDMSAAVADWLCTDLNPAMQCARSACSPESLLSGYGAYRRTAEYERNIDFATVMAHTRGGQDETAKIESACRTCTQALLTRILAEAEMARSRGRPAGPTTLAQTARYLSLTGGAALDIYAILESESKVSLPSLSRRVGCSIRTLHRQLACEGLTVAELRLAVKIERALVGMKESNSLADVAHAAGFSDQAHMTRVLKASGRMNPRDMRNVITGRPLRDQSGTKIQ